MSEWLRHDKRPPPSEIEVMRKDFLKTIHFANSLKDENRIAFCAVIYAVTNHLYDKFDSLLRHSKLTPAQKNDEFDKGLEAELDEGLKYEKKAKVRRAGESASFSEAAAAGWRAHNFFLVALMLNELDFAHFIGSSLRTFYDEGAETMRLANVVLGPKH